MRGSVFYSIPKAPKEGVQVKGACVRACVVSQQHCYTRLHPSLRPSL